ncbi:MAG: phosphatase domain-containing protein [Bacteroidota bacterium]
MRPWKRRLLNILQSIRVTLSQVALLLGWRRRKGKRRPLKIVPYRGYGTADSIHLQGRILHDRFIISTATDSLWKNLRNNLKRFLSKEIVGAQLSATIGKNRFELVTDREGYFQLQSPLPYPIVPKKGKPWQDVQLHLTQTPYQEIDIKATTEILLPKKAAFGIISDIDDTILETKVTSMLKLRMLYLTFMKNAFHRNAFQAVGAFYTALQKGPKQQSHNPVFYVSNSPWNLYDPLKQFLQLNYLPKGPILLRDFGIPAHKVPAHYQGHKKESIINILNTYPKLPFVLIGDSGERDADVYLSLAEDFPGRIRAIYIYDVKSERRARRIKKKIKKRAKIKVHLIKNYTEAAAHAAKIGLLAPEAFQALQEQSD